MANVEEAAPGVFWLNENSQRILATRNLTPGIKVYGERLIEVEGVEYRSWTPYRSKLAAAILKGLERIPVKPVDRVLYLGVASGTTCSHISDIVGPKGHIWGVDFAPRSMRDLVNNVARHRGNVSQILGDARRPNSYSATVPIVDGIYADVAQPDQAELLNRNVERFLKSGGWCALAIKSRSIDVTEDPRTVYRDQIEILRRSGLIIDEVLELGPYEKDHALVIARLPL